MTDRAARRTTPGASGAHLGQALAASAQHGYPRYQTLQPHYNLYERAGFEGALAELCVRENIGVITYFSLAAGFLTGKYRGEADFAELSAVKYQAEKLGVGGDTVFVGKKANIADYLGVSDIFLLPSELEAFFTEVKKIRGAASA